MSQAKDELVARAQDPNAELETLHQLAQNYPGLRPYIAANPRTYPALLEWLGTLGDPAVDAALASRSGQNQSAQSPQGEPQLAVVSPPGAQPASPSARSSEAPTQVTLPRSLQPGSASSGISGASGTSAISATSSRSTASASSAFSAAGANTQGDRFRASGPTVSDPTFHPTQAIPSQSPARPVQPALQQTFQQSANVSQAQSPVIPSAAQASATTESSAGVFGVGTEDDDSSAPSSFLTSNRILLILGVMVIIILVFLASWYLSGGDGGSSATGSDTQATTQSSQGAGAAPSAASASPKASATASASATPTLKAPAPSGAQEMSAFNAPSGNITCTLGDNEVTCTINEHAATSACPASRPLTVKIGTNGQSTQSCGSTFTPSGSSLNYNYSAKNSSFACTSTENGMQCWSQVSGEGFTLSREGVESTTHGR